MGLGGRGGSGFVEEEGSGASYKHWEESVARQKEAGTACPAVWTWWVVFSWWPGRPPFPLTQPSMTSHPSIHLTFRDTHDPPGGSL